jgi:hypothetical protein
MKLPTLKELKAFLLKAHKKNFDMIKNADSMHQRQSSARKMSNQDSQKDGAAIKRILDIEDEPELHPGDKEPQDSMALILRTWGVDDETEDEQVD